MSLTCTDVQHMPEDGTIWTVGSQQMRGQRNIQNILIILMHDWCLPGLCHHKEIYKIY